MKTITIILYTSFIVILGITLFYPYIYNTVSFINTLLIPLFIISIISLSASHTYKNLFSYYKNKKAHIIVQTIMLFVFIIQGKMESRTLNDEEINKHWIETGAEIDIFSIEGYLYSEIDTLWVKEYLKNPTNSITIDSFLGIAEKDNSLSKYSHGVFFRHFDGEAKRLSCFKNYCFKLKNGDTYFLNNITVTGVDMEKKELTMNGKNFGKFTYKVNNKLYQFKPNYVGLIELKISKSDLNH